jgi:hypothetical protein
LRDGLATIIDGGLFGLPNGIAGRAVGAFMEGMAGRCVGAAGCVGLVGPCSVLLIPTERGGGRLPGSLA